MKKLLQVTNIVSGYLNRPVIHGVSLEVNENSSVAVIGPNGHGKTTLLRTLSGFLPLRGGSIFFNGNDASHMRVQKRVEAGLVHVPQGDQLFSDMSVEENLLMGAYLQRDYSNTNKKLENIYDLFPKLKERSGQVASSLSGGERRMVGIGRGLMTDAKLMIFDEPSLGLAPLIIEQIYEALQELRKSGMAILVVEENPSRILNFADKICLLDAGHIVWSGTVDEAKSSSHILQTYLGG
tara:strand:+ start:1995 stop:2708 length:714 start_codon:yes stop_codon:yes gene_type:complete